MPSQCFYIKTGDVFKGLLNMHAKITYYFSNAIDIKTE